MSASLGDPNMIGSVLLCLGGLGLFLLGMVVLTEGLRALTGRALRRVLSRFTRSPRSGAMTGALTTAVVQSSSATTVATVGFVGAGLLTFPQGLGIVLGAMANPGLGLHSRSCWSASSSASSLEVAPPRPALPWRGSV